VRDRLVEGDVLVFTKQDDGPITVERRTSAPTVEGTRWGWLQPPL
jgi:hypothetical protein